MQLFCILTNVIFVLIILIIVLSIIERWNKFSNRNGSTFWHSTFIYTFALHFLYIFIRFLFFSFIYLSHLYMQTLKLCNRLRLCGGTHLHGIARYYWFAMSVCDEDYTVRIYVQYVYMCVRECAALSAFTRRMTHIAALKSSASARVRACACTCAHTCTDRTSISRDFADW